MTEEVTGNYSSVWRWIEKVRANRAASKGFLFQGLSADLSLRPTTLDVYLPKLVQLVHGPDDRAVEVGNR